jgi:C-terminal processing protease CtpA/Prc
MKLHFFYHQCLVQVGLVLKGVEVKNTVPGGPAFTSMCLEPGDVLIAVDGNFVTDLTVDNMLVGIDKPGTLVTLTVAKGGIQVNNLPYQLRDMG